MRFPISSSLLCRHNNVLLRRLNTPRAALIPSQPASSLSAIHHGLRQSQKYKPQGFSHSSLETAKPRRSSKTPRRNSRDPDWTPPDFKIRKGKKDITDTGPEAPSRRARFNDPEHSFGKRSFVYQAKHGALREKMAELEARGRSQTAPFSRRAPTDRINTHDFMKDFEASNGRSAEPTTGRRREPTSSVRARRPEERESRTGSFVKRRFDKERTRRPDISSSGPRRDDFTNTWSFEDNADSSGAMPNKSRRPDKSSSGFRSEAFTKRPEERESWTRSPVEVRSFDKERTRRPDISSSGPQREAFTDASSFQNHFESSRNMPRNSSRTRDSEGGDARGEHASRRDDGPIRVHHTTAASQFLYGRSVVEAALKNSRRQLYKLYIYNGDERQNVSQDDILTNLARKKGVEVTKLPNGTIHIMDKMSGGRPHNGYVLEASPLPQLPLKALGSLSEDPQKPGFHLELSHQSSEEAKINGTSNFVSYQLPKERNPFILFLDGILDPGNLGAILRTAAFLGVNGVAITKGSSATLTAVALKASAGASEVMTLFSVNSTVDFLARSKENGWQVYAAVPSTKRSKNNSHLTVDRVETYDPLSLQPTILVVGSEGEGLTKPVRRQADHEVSIPSPTGGFLNVVDSLNVSVATGILCSSFLRKQTSGMIEIEADPVPIGSEEDDSLLW